MTPTSPSASKGRSARRSERGRALSGRQFQILGALGSSRFSPILARERWPGGSRRVVLMRPSPARAAAASGCGSERVVAEEGHVRLEDQVLGVFRYVPGIDLDELLERTGGRLPGNAVDELADQVRAALADCPVPHGDLSGSAIRLTPHGVRLVGFSGREERDDADLAELLDELERGPDGEGLSQLLPDDPDPTLHPHPWAGRDLSETPEKPITPPKTRTAGIAALTLVLGLLAGKVLFSG